MFYISWLFKKKQTIEDIPTDRFYQLLETLKKDGWRITLDYMGFDKGIDHDKYVLKNEGVRLVLKWDNYMGGSIKGLPETIELIKARYLLD